MKKILLMILLVFLLCSCSSAPAAELTALQKQLSSVEEDESYISLSIGEAMNYFAFEEGDIEEAMIYISRDGLRADEIAVVRAVDGEAAERVLVALRDRIEERKNSFQSYAPAEYEKLSRTTPRQSGLYCYYAVGDSGGAADVFSEIFQ